MNWQLFDAFGTFLGFSSNLIASKASPQSSWRWQIAAAALPALILMVLIVVIPESPRWLLKKGRFGDAFASLCQLRSTRLLAAAELFHAHAQLQAEAMSLRPLLDGGHGQAEVIRQLTNMDYYRDAAHATPYVSHFSQLLRNACTRRATLAAAIVMIGQQLCGM